ncbi:MAG TPA: YfcE family phosphodiesterase [Desulfobacteraceae bacterium]|jgi:hypothetical protein|nr:YfcE family phosphodiesterase [Desulfobacteraceae bacterium]
MVNKSKSDVIIGVISDTHGLLRSEIGRVFKGVDLIAHAGDIDRPEVLKSLREIAPVVAVRGNMDSSKWAGDIPPTETFEAGGIMMYMLHNLDAMDSDPKAAGFRVVISGHTHLPLAEKKDGILFLNPGSAGPRRYDYPISVALLRIRDKMPNVVFIELEL